MPAFKGFFCFICKTVDISPDSINLTQNWYQAFHLELLQDHINFCPVELHKKKSVWENEASRFCFVLTIWPKAKVKITKME